MDTDKETEMRNKIKPATFRRHLMAAILRKRRTGRGMIVVPSKGGHSLATYIIEADITDADTVKGIVNGLRSAAKKLGVVPAEIGYTKRTVDGEGEELHTVKRYTREQFRAIVAAYNPRKAEYVAAKGVLLAA